MSITTVRVALRVRPLSEKESRESSDNNEHPLITFMAQQPQQISVYPRHNFTFDYVYPPDKTQSEVYNSCIQPLFDQFVNGYNATILAYGQTGSGKTYSMGTAGHMDAALPSEHAGIVPRFAENLFRWIENQQMLNATTTYQVKVSFLELYNEDINDLLKTKDSNSPSITIREDSNGHISWSGVYEQAIQQSTDLLGCLSQGAIARTTASTDMNSSSSRSHAIFTVSLTQHITTAINGTDKVNKKIESKFHFVDLAGSERLKKTNAVGERAKEGISINAGLLALGNVISALGDESKRSQQQHIPYRNSKLTRLLQDSLGGNSQTLMLACISPADSNASETLSTLKYANRAKNITNRVVVNQEQSPMDALKEEIAHLKREMQVNEAFIKEVHLELDDLRAKNVALQSIIESSGLSTTSDEALQEQGRIIMARKAKKLPDLNQSNIAIKEDDEVTLIGAFSGDDDRSEPIQMMAKSLSSKRKKKNKNKNNDQTKKKAAVAKTEQQEPKLNNDTIALSLNKHKSRLRDEIMIIKQMKAGIADVPKFHKLLETFSSSIKEQKQLIELVKQSAQSQESTVFKAVPATKKRSLSPIVNTTRKPSPVPLTKPSLIKQPTTFNNAANNIDLMHENLAMADQLRQIMAAVKKAMVMLNTPNTTLAQLRPILNRAAAIYSSGKSKDYSLSLTSTKKNDVKSAPINKKRVNIENIRKEIKRITAFEQIKTHPICLEMSKSLKSEKIRLMREQKDLLKERNEMLRVFYKDEYAEQQQKQQYMDERIDTITVQVDMLTEQIRLLQSESTAVSNNKNNHKLIDILKHLSEGDLRALILLIIQQDLVSLHLNSQIEVHRAQKLCKFQQGFVQLRRTSDEMNNQVLIDLLRSPVRCLSNGLVLISGK